MTIYDLKPKFQALLRPATRALHDVGVTANQVTLAACILSLILGAALCVWAEHRGLFLLLPLWLFLRMALNAIDGMLAREFGQRSDLGAFLNELTDVVSDAALYLPFAFLPHFGWLEVTVVIFLAVVSEMSGVVAVMTGASRRYDGPMGKSDRAFVLGALGLAIGLGLPPAAWQQLVFPLVALLLCVTVANRVRRGLAQTASGGNRRA
jgi:CDP-diacylglycerol--glycerol-3-phosphate 3-phosphatidyltransferase